MLPIPVYAPFVFKGPVVEICPGALRQAAEYCHRFGDLSQLVDWAAIRLKPGQD